MQPSIPHVKTYYLELDHDYHQPDASTNAELDNEALIQDTVEYYESCHNDYLFAWCNRQNLALHYGYWNSEQAYDHHEALLNTNRLLYETAQIQPHERVLDAGCGLGGSSLWISSEHGNEVVGITVSQKQADYANHQARRRQLDAKVNFEVADYCQTPFADASFDIVWALESSCYALKKDDLIREAFRLLRPGGRLILCDAFMLKREFNEREWKTVMGFLNGWMLPNLSDRTNFSAGLEQAGFKDIRIQDISSNVLPSSKHMYKTSRRLNPVQKISEWLGLRTATQTANHNAGLVQYDFFHDRMAEYLVFCATKP